MFDDIFDIADIGDFADAESVVEIADFGDVADVGTDMFDVGPDIFDATEFVAEDPTMFDDLSPDTGLFTADGTYTGADDWGDFSPPEPNYGDAIYDTAIGPGLNGTPGFTPSATQDGGFFGGIKSVLQGAFSGNPNSAAYRTNTAYGRQTLYRNGGNVYAAPRNVSGSGGISNFARSLFGNGSVRSNGRGGFFDDGSSSTSLFLMAGVGLLAVALLAKR